MIYPNGSGGHRRLGRAIQVPYFGLRKALKKAGRRLRSERTKQLIIEAFLALLREEPTMPTAVQIAERAGYSVRSIFSTRLLLLSVM